MLRSLRAAGIALLLGVAAPAAGHAAATGDDAAPTSATPSPAAAAPTAFAARLAGDAKRTRFVLDLTDAVEFGVFPLNDPHRVVVDLPETHFALPPEAGRDGRGIVAAWRYGLLASGKSRIVVDLAGPAAVDKAFMLPAIDGQPARLVIDLVTTSAAAFDADVVRARKARAAVAAGAAPPPAVSRSGRVRPLIVLDPGHGGIDTGAIGVDGTKEKTLTLDFAGLVKRKLEETGLFEVRLTRDDDVFIALGERVAIARAAAADLFVSIHADAAPQDFVRGATVYTVSDRASDAQAAAIAAQENRSDVIAGVDLPDTSDIVTDILIDLARRETKTLSHRAAEALVGELGTTVVLNNNPHRYAGFRVLRAHDVPSVLVELGYMTNRHDEALMLTQEWREKAATSAVAAIRRFFAPRIAGGAAESAATPE